MVTKTSDGNAEIGATFPLYLGQVLFESSGNEMHPYKKFEWQMTDADGDWINSKIGFSLISKDKYTEVNFYHTGWQDNNAHYKISSFCWAMYLRILNAILSLEKMFLTKAA